MEKVKKAEGRLPEYYQQVIDPGYKTGTAVFLISNDNDLEKVAAFARAARELYEKGGIKDLREKFPALQKALLLTGMLAFEKQEVKTKEQEPVIPFVLGKSHGKTDQYRNFTFSVDSDMDDSIEETMCIQGPLSKTARSYLRMMAKNMRDMDTAIDMAIISGNSEQVERLSNQWNTYRKDMMIYLGKNKLRVYPMRKKDKQKAIDKAETVEYKQEKSKGVKHPKTRGLARQRGRENNSY